MRNSAANVVRDRGRLRRLRLLDLSVRRYMYYPIRKSVSEQTSVTYSAEVGKRLKSFRRSRLHFPVEYLKQTQVLRHISDDKKAITVLANKSLANKLLHYKHIAHVHKPLVLYPETGAYLGTPCACILPSVWVKYYVGAVGRS